MKILVITDLYPTYKGKGATRNDVSHAIHLLVKGWIHTHEVLVLRPLYLFRSSWWRQLLKKKFFHLDGVTVTECTVIKFPKMKRFILGPIYKLIKKHFLPDIVISHLGFNLLLGYCVSKKFKLPLISGVHRGDFRYSINMLTPLKMELIYRHSIGIACRSYALQNELIQRFPDLGYKSFVAFSGIPLSIISPFEGMVEKLKRRFSQNRISFISVCSLVELKNIDVNLKAFSELNHPVDWEYKIIGSGPEASRLRKLCNQYGLQKKVKFLGFLSHNKVISELNASDVFIMISSHETFGLSYLEAMATGNIVIGSKGTGIDGVVRHRNNGFLCTARDLSDLKKTLSDIMVTLDETVLKEMLRRGWETIQNFTEEKATTNYLNHITLACQQWKKECALNEP